MNFLTILSERLTKLCVANNYHIDLVKSCGKDVELNFYSLHSRVSVYARPDNSYEIVADSEILEFPHAREVVRFEPDRIDWLYNRVRRLVKRLPVIRTEADKAIRDQLAYNTVALNAGTGSIQAFGYTNITDYVLMLNDWHNKQQWENLSFVLHPYSDAQFDIQALSLNHIAKCHGYKSFAEFSKTIASLGNITLSTEDLGNKGRLHLNFGYIQK